MDRWGGLLHTLDFSAHQFPEALSNKAPAGSPMDPPPTLLPPKTPSCFLFLYLPNLSLFVCLLYLHILSQSSDVPTHRNPSSETCFTALLSWRFHGMWLECLCMSSYLCMIFLFPIGLSFLPSHLCHQNTSLTGRSSLSVLFTLKLCHGGCLLSICWIH